MQTFLHVCFIIRMLTSTTLNDLTTNASTIQQQFDYLNALHFLLIGDWGKGGNSGGYATSYISDSNKSYDDDLNEESFEKSKSNSSIKNLIETSRGLKDNKQTYQAAIASAMGSYSDNFKPSFVIALGDNFYANGVSSSTDAYWDYLWTNVYLDYYESLRVPWFPVFGNHDYGYGAKGIQAQLDRSLIDDYWSFKSTNYSKTYDIPNGGTVIIVFVDTTTLAPSVNKCCNENGGISTAVQATRIENQLRHIDAMLDAASQKEPTWLLVAGHYPIFSIGEHGDNSELQSYLQPLLRRYNVDAYFCGHDHLSEHLFHAGTHYFVAGGGSMTDYVGATSSAKTLWTGEGYSAFASAAATEEELTITFIDMNNEVRYKYALINLKEKLVPSPFPSTSPLAVHLESSSKFIAAIISGKIMVIPIILLVIAFAYDTRQRRRRRKIRNTTPLLISSMAPESPFNEFMRGNTRSPPKDSNSKMAMIALLISQKSDEDPSEEGADEMLASVASATPCDYKSQYDIVSKRGLISLPSFENTLFQDVLKHNHTENKSNRISAMTIPAKLTDMQRSFDKSRFDKVPTTAGENHKRARTSLF